MLDMFMTFLAGCLVYSCLALLFLKLMIWRKVKFSVEAVLVGHLIALTGAICFVNL